MSPHASMFINECLRMAMAMMDYLQCMVAFADNWWTSYFSQFGMEKYPTV